MRSDFSLDTTNAKATNNNRASSVTTRNGTELNCFWYFYKDVQSYSVRVVWLKECV